MSKLISHPTLYFAYGSNMSARQMAIRCPGAPVAGPALLRGRRFVINLRGHATLVPDPTRLVHGVLWNLSPDHETALDGYESVALDHYRKEYFRVELPDHRAVKAMAYIATDATPGQPLESYLSGILQAAATFGFPTAYLEELARWKST